MSGPADNTGLCPTCSMMPHVHGCTPGKCGAPVEHPLPWRWEDDGSELKDAHGVLLIGTTENVFDRPSPYVRAVTERAGAMEALLRSLDADFNGVADLESRFVVFDAKRVALLAEIDKAKEGGPVPVPTPYSRVLRDPKMSNPDVPHAFKPNGLMRGCRCGRDEDDPIHNFHLSDEEMFVAEVAKLRDLVSVAPRGSTPEHYTAVLTDSGRGFSASGEVPEGEDEQVTVDRLMDDVVAQALAARKAGG